MKEGDIVTYLDERVLIVSIDKNKKEDDSSKYIVEFLETSRGWSRTQDKRLADHKSIGTNTYHYSPRYQLAETSYEIF